MAVPSSLLLPLKFDAELLLRDLHAAAQYQWPEHYNQNDYAGSWTSLSLRSHDGNMQNVYATPSDSFSDTALLAVCPYFASVMQEIHCEKLTVRLLSLQPGSEIKPHRDQGLSYLEGEFRLHVPIVTNPDVEFVVDDQRLLMQPGECWYADFTREHSVANHGKAARVHLVLDCIRNDWTDALFRAQGYDVDAAPAERPRSREEVEAMIAAFEASGNAELVKQAAELRCTLGQGSRYPS